MENIHKKNAARLQHIVNESGWPGKSLVGEDGAEAAWLMLQHDIGEPDFMQEMLAVLQEAAAKNEIDPRNVAILVDRIRVYERRPQVYGTNFDWDENGELNPTVVDELRKSIGLPYLVEDIREKRMRMATSNERAPGDIAAYRRQAEEWSKSVGWRK
jgi:hypothetical protein